MRSSSSVGEMHAGLDAEPRAEPANQRWLVWLALVSAALYVGAMHLWIYASRMGDSDPLAHALRPYAFWGVSIVYAASVAYSAFRGDAWLRGALGAVPAGLAIGLSISIFTTSRAWNEPLDYGIYTATLSAWPIVIVAPLCIMIVGVARFLWTPPAPDDPL